MEGDEVNATLFPLEARMKIPGNNELHFNEATMIVAMQQYLDSILVSSGAVTVESIEQAATTNYAKAFVVKIKSTEIPGAS